MADEVLRLDRYTAGARQVVVSAQALADARHHEQTTALHLLAVLLGLEPVLLQLLDVEADPHRASTMTNEELAAEPTSTEPSSLSPHALAVVNSAASESGTRPVSLADLLRACIKSRVGGTLGDLYRAGIAPAADRIKVERIVLAARLDRILHPSPADAFMLAYLPSRHRGQAARRELLERVTEPMTAADAALKRAVETARRAVQLQDPVVAEANAELAAIARSAGIALRPIPTDDTTAWLVTLPDAVRPHLTSPVLEAAWTAGEAACTRALEAAVNGQLADLQRVAPALALPPAPTPDLAPAPRHPHFPGDPITRTCVACQTTFEYPDRPPERRTPHVDEDASGLDGRPSYGYLSGGSLATDALILARELALVECPTCSHIAPWIEVALPCSHLAREARAAFSALAGHSELARRYLYVAQLYGDADPYEEGQWVLRAAWADEAEGHKESARRLRLRAGLLLEDVLFQSRALVNVRAGSSLMLTEIFRVAGSFERAAEHCRRGLQIAPSTSATKRALFIEARHIVERDMEVLTRGGARAELDDPRSGVADANTRQAIVDRLRALCPVVPRIRLRAFRRFNHTRASPDMLDMFRADFLDRELLLELLRVNTTVWAGIVAHPQLLPALLEATGHEDEVVRRTAVDALYGKVLSKAERTVHAVGFDAELLHGQTKAVDALAGRLADDDATMVRKAGAILRQVIFLDGSCAPRIAAAARGALAKWSHDLSTEGVLERLIELAPPPGTIGSDERRARTLAEMHFAASLRPCSTCGAPPAALELAGKDDRWTLSGRCPFCSDLRIFGFFTHGDPRNAPPPPPHELGDARPSQLITAAYLGAELERLQPLITARTAELPAPLRERNTALRDRALTCVLELQKLAPSELLVAERDRLRGIPPPA